MKTKLLSFKEFISINENSDPSIIFNSIKDNNSAKDHFNKMYQSTDGLKPDTYFMGSQYLYLIESSDDNGYKGHIISMEKRKINDSFDIVDISRVSQNEGISFRGNGSNTFTTDEGNPTFKLEPIKEMNSQKLAKHVNDLFNTELYREMIKKYKAKNEVSLTKMIKEVKSQDGFNKFTDLLTGFAKEFYS
jgi:hypothetical protein